MTLDSAFNQTVSAADYIPRAATDRCLAELDEWSRLGKAPIAILVGPSGVGKTLMLRILESRTRARLEPVYVPNPIFGPREMAMWALDSLTTPPEENQEAAFLQFADDLRRRGSGVVLLVDDAELLPTPTEEWLLAKASEHMRIVLAVSDEAWSDRLATLAGDAGHRICLSGVMTGDETRDFILSKLDRLEASPEIRAIFDDAALQGVHERAEGIPVQVQNEAAMLLHTARAAEIQSAPYDADTSFSLARGIVSVGSADDDIGSAFGPRPEPGVIQPDEDHHRPTRWVELAAAFAFGLVVAGLVAVLNSGEPHEPDTLEPTAAALRLSEPMQTAAAPGLSEPTQTAAAPGLSEPMQTAAAPGLSEPMQTAAAPPPSAPPLATADVDLPSVSNAPPATAGRDDVERAAPEATTSGPAKVAAAAPPPNVLVDVNAKPWGVVFVDGEQLGETPLAEIPMRPGRHDFAVRMPDGRWIERRVDIRADNRRLRFE